MNSQTSTVANSSLMLLLCAVPIAIIAVAWRYILYRRDMKKVGDAAETE